MNKQKARDVWVDNVKVVACILVVIGHFYQSMVKSGLAGDSMVYNWFNNTIYYFHVPLFFICSGYLFQKYSKVFSVNAWIRNVLKKLIALGIPYFVFSLITWLLKTIFSESVNSQVDSLLETFFLHPASPYWYLYILFILFCITVNTSSIRQQMVLLAISFAFKLIACFNYNTGIYFVDRTMTNWIWFVLGMTLVYNIPRLCNVQIGVFILTIFLIGSTLVEYKVISGGVVGFILGLLACFSIISIIHSVVEKGASNKFWKFGAKYTMPVFLMHTLFAASLRSLLLKIGINSLLIHVTLGVTISFIGPVIAMIVLEKLKPIDFVVYPTKYIKIEKKEH